MPSSDSRRAANTPRRRTRQPRVVAPSADTVQTEVRPGDEIGGYRLVRKLGVGSRATVYLGFASGEEPDGVEPAELTPPTVAIKVFHSPVSGLPNAELEALSRSTHPHALRLLDLAMTAGGQHCVIVERLPRGSLAALLAARASLLPGEAVTILAPIVAAVAALHGEGIVHGAVGTSAVLFRESGAPVLTGFGSARLIAPHAPAAVLDADGGVVADREATASLVMAVLENVVVTDRSQDNAMEDLRAVLDTAPGSSFFDDCESRLFALGTPQAVVFGQDAPVRDGGVVSRVPGTVARDASVLEHNDSAARISLRAGVARVRSLVATLGSVRKPVWIALAIVGCALIAVLAIDSGGERAASSDDQTVSDDVGGEEKLPDPPDRTDDDDPLVALDELIARRARCFAEISVRCLDEVDQAGSTALARDTEAIRSIQDGGELTHSVIESGGATVIELLGDTALVRLGTANGLTSKPASLLMMRGKAGWRIRDYLEE